DRDAALRVVAGETPGDRAAPVVPYPDGAPGAKRFEQLQHVRDDVLEHIVLVARIDTRAAVAAHVRRHGAAAKIGETAELMAPADGKLGPAMQEDDRWRIRRAARQVERRVAVGSGDVFCDGEDHSVMVAEKEGEGRP